MFSKNDSEQAIYLEYEGDKNNNKIPDLNEIGIVHLKGDGDFRSKESIELLKQAELVDTLEEYSAEWLNKHKSTASYLIHKKKDLSTNTKVNCLNNVNHHLKNLNLNLLQNTLNSKILINLEQIKKILEEKILKKL